MEHTKELEERVVNLEMKITYQDTTIEQLNSVVTDLRAQVDRLESIVQRVSEKVVNAFVNDDIDVKPPHY